jgi:arginase family enzyme
MNDDDVNDNDDDPLQGLPTNSRRIILCPAYTLEVLLFCVDRHFDTVNEKDEEEDADDASLLWRGAIRNCRPVHKDDIEKIVSMRVFTVGLEDIERISAVRIFTPQAVHTPEARKKVALSLQEVKKRFPDEIPLLDPIKDLGIEDDSFTRRG